MKHKIFLLIASGFFILLGCAQKEKDNTIVLITVAEMDSLLQIGQVQLIDVRTPEEFTSGYIPGAINIDYRNENFKELIEKVDKTKPVAVYCAKGGRSGRCATYMKKAGFTKIYDLDGGITRWKFKGKKVNK